MKETKDSACMNVNCIKIWGSLFELGNDISRRRKINCPVIAYRLCLSVFLRHTVTHKRRIWIVEKGWIVHRGDQTKQPSP